jgi:hypothetical protein
LVNELPVVELLLGLDHGTPGLDTEKRTRLIQALVPIAVSSPTSLDTVLSRLLLVAQPDDPKLMEGLPDELESLKGESGFAWQEAVLSGD